MRFIKTTKGFPFSSAVIHSGSVLETVLTGIPEGADEPVEGGAGAEMREIFRQLDEVLAEAGLDMRSICSARLYLQHVNRDVAEINEAWVSYFGDHPPNRRCYGVDLQRGMLVEAGFVAELPE